MNTPSINPHKSKYKIRNRQAYNASLSKRGSLTLFLSDELLKDRSSLVSGKQAAGELRYLQGILQCCLLIRLNCRLPYRQSAGFLKSLFRLAGKESLPVPDYTTLCCRQTTLPVETGRRLQRGENPVAGTDSTGLKVCGEGEWKVRRHGRIRRRTWRKLYVCVDLATQEILTVALTGNREDDAAAGSRIWKEVQGCHQRSLNGTVMFRYKTIFGGELKARTAAIKRQK